MTVSVPNNADVPELVTRCVATMSRASPLGDRRQAVLTLTPLRLECSLAHQWNN
ncbi:hypothetical protein [Mycolicibacterium hodleri]|uniref:hypothetical protein n=1 Tax=Mycolicibacterium hodleri TaxID=49897 RepID=UPI0013762664|nr:hypothetical protein [Mycolicibacterium hodleri]